MNNRLALVIGNADYWYVSKLKNPKNDANDIESILCKLNFDVIKVLDARLLNIQEAINVFLQKLDEYAVGLLYYAGHGMQIDGKNYLVPVDVNETCEKNRTKVSCYCMDCFLRGVSVYRGKTIICILDACRNNPFAIERGGSVGFVPFDNPPKGVIIAYSTSADQGAFDGDHSNGLYTQVLKESMIIPNLKIEEMFKQVRNKVADISINKYGSEQLSWEYSSLVGDFYFSVTQQPVNLSVTDDEIYEFINVRREEYERTTEDISDIECMPYIDAYNKFHIPIIKLMRAYSRVDLQKHNKLFSDATIDQLNANYLSSWGFAQKYGRWYYKNQYVEMGDLLPIPKELEPLDPVKGKALKIGASLTSEMEKGRVRIRVVSNIPEETPVMFTLNGRNYRAQCKSVVNAGDLVSDWFSNKGKALKEGFYVISISAPVDRVLPDKVKKIFGERNRNIYGRYVKYEPIGGNTINFSYGLMIRNEGVQIIEMQQKI